MNRIVFIILLGFCSCKKSSEVLPPDSSIPNGNLSDSTLTLAYHVVVTDTTISAINIRGNVALLNGNMWVPESRTWFSREFTGTMLFIWSRSAYKGYRAQIIISVDTFSVPPKGYFFRRYYMLPIDTVSATLDTVISFRWPDDTLKSIFKGVSYFY